MHLEAQPDWLRALVPVLLAGQPADWVQRWRNDLQAALTHLGGPVPFARVHAWQAEVVLPRLPEGIEDSDHASVAALQQLHRRAALGLNGRRGEWLAALKPLLPALYRRAFPYATGYARAHALALEYATAPANTAMIAEHFGDARGYADYYAELSTEANAAAFADANSRAYAHMAAGIFADNDAAGYAGICVGATRVWALACAGSGEQDGECRRRMLRDLAEGLINS
ncbi:hypothetical protein [Pseudomonas gingeri]|uniref:hypothetical protein n=1 Tax=Pseudomonas gingeri TaxID=117681 RepID=UPI0015A1741D|nr:hypothetical protein [Pseudomonas gingeri]NWE47347.1 hypothetical protein [Pseudomonas gingeri]